LARSAVRLRIGFGARSEVFAGNVLLSVARGLTGMGWDELIPLIVIVSASGVLSPGPLFVVTVTSSLRNGPWTGLKTSTGHALVEFPLVMAIAAGLSTVLQDRTVHLAIGLIGGAALVAFGLLGTVGALKRKGTEAQPSHHQAPKYGPLLAGTLFTGLNPFFIAWWLTVGASLISRALELASFAGVVLLFASHIWMDYAWLTFVGYAAYKGLSVTGHRVVRYAELTLSLVLVFLGFWLGYSILLTGPSAS
jgi:threonine/homoserine/homoserine lactone efflux protein